MWAWGSNLIAHPSRRESYLSLYAPLALMLLLATWAAGLILGFGMMHWGLGAHLSGPQPGPGFLTALYFSGTTLFTLGLGDISPTTGAGRFLTVIEAGVGVGVLARAGGSPPGFS